MSSPHARDQRASNRSPRHGRRTSLYREATGLWVTNRQRRVANHVHAAATCPRSPGFRDSAESSRAKDERPGRLVDMDSETEPPGAGPPPEDQMVSAGPVQPSADVRAELAELLQAD